MEGEQLDVLARNLASAERAVAVATFLAEKKFPIAAQVGELRATLDTAERALCAIEDQLEAGR